MHLLNNLPRLANGLIGNGIPLPGPPEPPNDGSPLGRERGPAMKNCVSFGTPSPSTGRTSTGIGRDTNTPLSDSPPPPPLCGVDVKNVG